MLYFYNQYTRLSKTVETVRVLEVERFVAENIIKTYSGGICLIQGTFYFLDEETGEPLMMMGRGNGVSMNIQVPASWSVRMD